MEPQVGDYVYIKLEGEVSNVTTETIALENDIIYKANITNLQIQPKYTPGVVLYASAETFYLKLQSGDWVYSADGSPCSEEYVMDMMNANLIAEERPKK